LNEVLQNVPGRAGNGHLSRQRRVSLCETLDRVLNKGAVVAGDIVISVADVDLLYLGVNLVVTSVESMRSWDPATAQGGKGPLIKLPTITTAGGGK
jgi:hypothetical protein